MASIEKRTTDDGNITYRVKIRIKGFPTQTASFSRKTDAANWAKITEGAIRDRRYFRHSEAKKRTLKELIDRYIEDALPNKPKSTEVHLIA